MSIWGQLHSNHFGLQPNFSKLTLNSGTQNLPMFSVVSLGPFPPSQGALSVLYCVILLIILLLPEIFALPSSKSQKYIVSSWLKYFPCSFASFLQLKA